MSGARNRVSEHCTCVRARISGICTSIKLRRLARFIASAAAAATAAAEATTSAPLQPSSLPFVYALARKCIAHTFSWHLHLFNIKYHITNTIMNILRQKVNIRLSRRERRSVSAALSVCSPESQQNRARSCLRRLTTGSNL